MPVPTQPIFQTKDAVLAALRLSGIVGKESDAMAIFDQALMAAKLRMGFMLGPTKLQELVDIVPDHAGITQVALMRSLAALQETRLVRLELLKVLPVMFLDTSPAARSAWNQEAILENGDIDQNIARLEAQIENAWSLLSGDIEFGQGPKATKSAVIGRKAGTEPYIPGQNIINPPHSHYLPALVEDDDA